MNMDRVFFGLGAVSAMLAVGAGAFGAHALRARISPEHLAIFETGARYQIYHALALLAVAWAVSRWPGSLPVIAGWLFVLGSILFSGSLYILALTGVRWWGAVTPVGGLAFLGGWVCLVLTAVRR
jgi:uncharacterized membrane protein YgdD (TMEM256/DUF423 family)